MTSFRREIKFEPGHAKRGDYGLAAMTIRFLLHGQEATIQFVLSTGWYPEKIAGRFGDKWNSGSPQSWDLGYHANEPQYEDHSSFECDFRPGKRCYYDGSGLNAEPVMEKFMAGGEEAVWTELERYYNIKFSGNLSSLTPLPREEFTEDQLKLVDGWYARVTTQPAQGDYSFFQFLDRSSDGRLGGDKVAAVLDMPLSVYYEGKWYPLDPEQA